ncbi:MAG: hypothetical protein JWN50_642 [Parcubacteria group bacterium]|nr:hypothetical protein [Parcubacteria group bacterium]
MPEKTLADNDIEAEHSRYVVSEDIRLLLASWCKENNFEIPDAVFFEALRRRMHEKLESIFPHAEVVCVSEAEIVDPLHALLAESNDPTVSLDRVYTQQELLLDYTRLVDKDYNFIGLGSRTQESISRQVARIADSVKRHGSIQLVDDVVFSGDGIVEVIEWFNAHNIKVSRVVAGISINESRERVVTACANDNPGISVVSVKHFSNVLDEICERDFYPGVPLAGRLIGMKGADHSKPLYPELGAPYILPYGKPEKWASIPGDRAREWSLFCLDQAQTLWRIIERLSSRSVFCEDLSRRPVFASEGTRIVEELGKQMAAL